MEKKSKVVPLSKVSWVLVGVRANNETPVTEEQMTKMVNEAFIEGKRYTLFLCGEEVDKSGDLKEMEDGYYLLKAGMKDYKDGDYCIISTHPEGSLLFLPKEIEENA
jgi:hypothetical protein